MEAEKSLTVFKFEGTREVRTVLREGEPWFVAKDVCDILDISQYRDAISRSEEHTSELQSPG